MIRNRSAFVTPIVVSFLLAIGACADSTTEPPVPASLGVFVLNSTGQTLASFAAGDDVSAAAASIDLGAGFDGDAFDLTAGYAVTTVSSFGGSRILFVDLASGTILTTTFPAPETDLANPSAASFDTGGTAWIGGRGSDGVYRASPGDAVAERVASNVGTFIERVLPVGDQLVVVDANIDDDGGSYAPLGPGRIVLLSRAGLETAVIELPPSALNPTEAVAAAGNLLVLAAGTFDPVTFLPSNDGSLVTIDLGTGAVGSPVSLGGNGVSLELGLDGFVYVTTTSDYQSLNLLQFDPGARAFSHGPLDPLPVTDGNGTRVDCWSATGLSDGRIACVTFSFAEAGRLVLTDERGAFIDEIPSGFGSTDVASR